MPVPAASPHSVLALDAAAVDAVVAEADRRGWDADVEPLASAATVASGPAFAPAVRVRLAARVGGRPVDVGALVRAVPGVVRDDVRRPPRPPRT